MKIEEQVLSREQMAHLVELGIDTADASMCWLRYDADGEVRHFVSVNDEMCYEMSCAEPCPTYTIGDLIEKLPKSVDGDTLLFEFCLSDVGYGIWECSELYGISYQCNFKDKSLKDALYELLCLVAENHKELIK